MDRIERTIKIYEKETDNEVLEKDRLNTLIHLHLLKYKRIQRDKLERFRREREEKRWKPYESKSFKRDFFNGVEAFYNGAGDKKIDNNKENVHFEIEN